MSGLLSPAGLLREMTAADRTVAVALLVLSGALAFVARAPASAPEARVFVDSELVMTLPLDRAGLHDVQGRLGRVRVEVAGGRIRVSESGCAQRICMAEGARSGAGEMIACVPNALVIRLGGTRAAGAPDAVAR